LHPDEIKATKISLGRLGRQRRGVRREKDVFFSFAGERPANESSQPLHGRILLNTPHATKLLSDAP